MRVERGNEPARGETFAWALIDSAPDGVIVVEEGGRIVVANRRAEELFGYSRGELLGMSVEDLVPEPLRHHHIGHRSDYATDPRPRSMGTGRHLNGRRRDGTAVQLDISLSPVYRNRARIVIAILRPIRPLRQHEPRSDDRLPVLANQVLDGLREVALHLHDPPGSAIDSELMLRKLDDLVHLITATVFEDAVERIGDGSALER